MNYLFLDSWYWIAILSPGSHEHQQASRALIAESASRLVTTQEVLTEFLNFASEIDAHARTSACLIVQEALSIRKILIVSQSKSSFNRGFDLYFRRPDKGYSLTDCISMTTMRELGIHAILTNDHHFEQENFRILIRRG